MKINPYRNYWYLALFCLLPLLSATFLYLEKVYHNEFLLHLAAIPLEILFGAVLVERFMAIREKHKRIRHWAFVKSCLMRSQLREIVVANFAGMENPRLSLDNIRDLSAKQLEARLPELQDIQYYSNEAMEHVVDEYVAAYRTFYDLMEWAINNEFEEIFHDMIFVLHFIHDVESFHSLNPDKSFVNSISDDPIKFAKVKKVLTDGIIKFVEYAIELKRKQPDVFQALITDIVYRSHHHESQVNENPSTD